MDIKLSTQSYPGIYFSIYCMQSKQVDPTLGSSPFAGRKLMTEIFFPQMMYTKVIYTPNNSLCCNTDYILNEILYMFGFAECTTEVCGRLC